MSEQTKNISQFEIVLQGTINNEPVNINNFDISKLKNLISDIEDLIRKPLGKDLAKENITLKYEEGSVKLTLFAAITIISNLFSDLNIINETKNIYQIDRERAKVISKWQNQAKETDLTFFINDFNKNPVFKIDNTTNYVQEKPQLIDVEIILYGEITDLGGKTNPNIHIDTNQTTFTIPCNKEDLINQNRLYTYCGIKLKAKQDLNTFEISKEGMRFIEFIDYTGNLEGDELTKFIEEGTKIWKDVPNSVDWQRNLRDDEN